MSSISGRFEELRELCSAAGDKASLAIGMTGLAIELLYAGRAARGVAAGIRTDGAARVDRRSDPDHWGWRFMAICIWYDTGEIADDLAVVADRHRPGPTATPPRAPASVVGSPLAMALAWRGVARWWLGRPGWRQDLDDAVAMARNSDPVTHAAGRHLEVRLDDLRTGCFGPTTPRCASRRGAADRRAFERRYRAGPGRVHAGCRAGASGRRSGPSARAGVADAGPRHVAARAGLFAEYRSSICGPRGRGPGAATAMVPYR